MAAILHCIATGIEDARARDLLQAWRGKSLVCPLMCEIRHLRKQSALLARRVRRLESVGTALCNEARHAALQVYLEQVGDGHGFGDDPPPEAEGVDGESLMNGINAWDTEVNQAVPEERLDIFENESESVTLSRSSSVDTVSSVSTDSSSLSSSTTLSIASTDSYNE